MTTLQELKNHLDEKQIATQFTWVDNPTWFEGLTTSQGINSQTNCQTLPLDARCWIDYDAELDEFTFRVSYFTHEGLGINREQFAAILPQYPIANYTESNYLKWKNENGSYVLHKPSVVIINLPIKTITRKS